MIKRNGDEINCYNDNDNDNKIAHITMDINNIILHHKELGECKMKYNKIICNCDIYYKNNNNI